MEKDLCILNIDTIFKNPSTVPIDKNNIANAPPSTNDPNGTGLLPTDITIPFYPANSGNYMHILSEPIKHVTGVRLSSIEFPNVNFIFSQAKGSNSFTLVIPKDKLTTYQDDNNLYDSDDEIQFNTNINDPDYNEPYRITIVIPDGLYSYTTLLDQIQSIFNNINNAQYVNNSVQPLGVNNNNQANYSSYPHATINLNIWYNLVTFKITITNTDYTFKKTLPFGLEFPANSTPGPSLQPTDYLYEVFNQGAYGVPGATNSGLASYADFPKDPNNLKSTQVPSPFLPLAKALPKNNNPNPFDATYNRTLGYLLGFRKTIYRIQDCKLISGTDHQTGGATGNGAIISNTIYPVQPYIPAPNAPGASSGSYGIPPSMAWISESILDTQGDAYILMKINNYGNIVHENNPIIYQQTTGYIKNSKGELILDSSGKPQPLIRRQYSRKQDKYFAKILLVSGKGNLIFDNGANFLTKEYNFRQPTEINKLHITLHESNGELLNLQGFDYSLTLEFTYIVSSLLKTKLEAGLLNVEQPLLTLTDNSLVPNPINNNIVNNVQYSNQEVFSNDTIISNKYMTKDPKKKKKKNKFNITY
jgi:hypothetical protein